MLRNVLTALTGLLLAAPTLAGAQQWRRYTDPPALAAAPLPAPNACDDARLRRCIPPGVPQTGDTPIEWLPITRTAPRAVDGDRARVIRIAAGALIGAAAGMAIAASRHHSCTNGGVCGVDLLVELPIGLVAGALTGGIVGAVWPD